MQGVSEGVADVYGEAASDEVTPIAREIIPLSMLYKDFKLFWRDVAASRQLCAPMDVSEAAAAAAMLARAEDRLIFYGAKGQPGLMNADGRAQSAKASGWNEVGSALASVVDARRLLVSNGAMGPYALGLSADLYTRLLRVMGQVGRLELSLVQQVADAGVFQTPSLAPGDGVLVSVGPDVLDLAVSEDMQVAYLGPSNMNHSFRLFESVALRIRRPKGICVLA